MFNQKLDAPVRAWIVYAGNNGRVSVLTKTIHTKWLRPSRGTSCVPMGNTGKLSVQYLHWLKNLIKKCPDFKSAETVVALR